MARKSRYIATNEDINYIINNSTGRNAKTDKEMAEHIGCSVPYIRKIRKKHNIVKAEAPINIDRIAEKEIKKGVQAGVTVIDSVKTNRMTIAETKEMYKRLFKNTQQYDTLRRMYSEHEVHYYLEEFSTMVAEVKAQGGTLESSEMRNLDTWIQLTIRRNRLLEEEKIIKDGIASIMDKYDNNIVEMDDNDKSTVFQLQNSIKDTNRNLKEITEQSIKVQQSLDMTRQERVKRMSDSQQGILKIIQTMQDDTERARVERQAALMEKSMEKVQNEWEDSGLIFSVESLEKEKEQQNVQQQEEQCSEREECSDGEED